MCRLNLIGYHANQTAVLERTRLRFIFFDLLQWNHRGLEGFAAVLAERWSVKQRVVWLPVKRHVAFWTLDIHKGLAVDVDAGDGGCRDVQGHRRVAAEFEWNCGTGFPPRVILFEASTGAQVRPAIFGVATLYSFVPAGQAGFLLNVFCVIAHASFLGSGPLCVSNSVVVKRLDSYGQGLIRACRWFSVGVLDQKLVLVDFGNSEGSDGDALATGVLKGCGIILGGWESWKGWRI